MNLLILESLRSEYRLSAQDPVALHLRSVLRVGSGDRVRIGVVNGPRGEATVVDIDEDWIRLAAEWDDSQAVDRTLPISVILGHPRPPVLTRLWRDLSAIGVERIIVFSAVLTERSYMLSTVWNETRRYLTDGLSQGMHTALPEVIRAESLQEALALVGEEARRYAAIPGVADAVTLDTLLRTVAEERFPVAVCIGPERGLVDSERSLLEQERFVPVGLGRGILRTETATIVLAGAVAASMGHICSERAFEL